MKRSLVLMLIFGLCLLAAGCFLYSCGSSGDDDDDDDDSSNPDQHPMVIDHTCTNLSRIPVQWLDQARASLRIGYGHTSHGSQPVTGMFALNAAAGSNYDFTYSGWGLETGIFFNDEWGNAGGASDLGYDGDLTWRDATVAMLAESGCDRNVVIWSWCGGVSDNSSSGINTYLNAMNELEQQYPNVRFVYMTGHLDGTASSGNLTQRNNQIRDYCRANNKILFDFADIESYNPDGTTDFMALYANDACDYDSDGDSYQDRNWAQDWYDNNPDSELAHQASYCDDCAHSHYLNCILKARAFWWLFARMAGWDGN